MHRRTVFFSGRAVVTVPASLSAGTYPVVVTQSGTTSPPMAALVKVN
jgi:hypothetical protein